MQGCLDGHPVVAVIYQAAKDLDTHALFTS